MILEALLSLLFDIISAFFKILPIMDFVIPTDWITFAGDAMSVVCYILPMGTVKSIISIILALLVFRFWVSFIKNLWGLLPFA